ncbi:hypothetical protein [Thermodesulfatator atlanticus]|uniref:hypothetical protein n=1 Tax=Thermodesulfatator atlanticus TaxID=501497 RepID=UPI0003B59678|nr:hypothetical protein [Thermodesulfatator atlanticus]
MNDDGWADIWNPYNWYSKWVYAPRQYDASAPPDTAHEIVAKADYTLNAKTMFQGNIRYYYGENDELQVYKYEREAFNAGVNVTYTPFSKLGLNAGYNFFWDETQSRICSAFYYG